MKFFPGIGIDEVGRGAWAGPFVACAVLVTSDALRVRGVKDSKMLGVKQREELARLLQKRHVYGVGVVDVKELDAMGMTKAQALVFERALAALHQSSSWPRPGSDSSSDSAAFGEPRLGRGQARMTTNTIHIDGLSIKAHPEWKAIVDGDQTIYSIAAASIIAKVYRDGLMYNLHEEEPRYQFHLHKGYGTQLHQRLLAEHGACIHHRRLFEPIRKLYTIAR